MAARDLRGKLLKGTGALVGVNVAKSCVDLGANIALARLLAPEVFGIAALALFSASFFSTMGELGIGSALIQRKQPSALLNHSVYWLMVSFTLILWSLATLAAPIAARFFGHPILSAAIPVAAATLPIGAFGSISRVQIHRKLRYSESAFYGLASTVLGSLAAVLMAAAGGGVWALVVRPVVAATVLTISYRYLEPWRPELRMSLVALASIKRFAGFFFFENLFAYLSRNLDTALVGKILGAGELGVYNRAYSIMLLPLKYIAAAVGGPSFSALSTLRDEPSRYQALVLRASGLLTACTLPICAGIGLTAKYSVPFLLGPGWDAAIPVVQVMAMASAAEASTAVRSGIYLSLGRTDVSFRYRVLFRTLLIAGIVSGVHWGTEGVAWGYTVASLLGVGIDLRKALRLAEVSLVTYIAYIKWELLCVASLGLSVVALDRALLTPLRVSSAGGLVPCVLVGAGTYGVLWLLSQSPSKNALLAFVKSERLSREGRSRLP